MDLLLHPTKLRGTVTPPPSKSESHRLILTAALAEGESRLRGLAFSDDLRATLRGAAALGASWTEPSPGELRIRGGAPRLEPIRLDCGASGSTLRFMIPLSLALCGGGDFTGDRRLLARPLEPYLRLFEEHGVSCSRGETTLRLRGALRPGEYRLSGALSSQFFSGLLFALPLLDGPSRLRWTSPPVSMGYLRMTGSVLSGAGVELRGLEDGYEVFPSRPRPLEAEPDRDWSQAAFWIAARELGGGLLVLGLDGDSPQPDRVVMERAERLRRGGDLTLDLSQCPDLLPPLAVIAALRRGSCRLCGAARLRGKESDRLASVTAALGALGAEIREEADGLWIRGRESLPGGCEADSARDHRVAMAVAVAATRCERPVLLRGADCVNKSYPDFWDVYQSLGGRFDAVELG